MLTQPDDTVAQYREVQKRLGPERVVVVQATAYGLDNRCRLEAFAELGVCAVSDETAHPRIEPGNPLRLPITVR
jgi:hypothetical protein